MSTGGRLKHGEERNDEAVLRSREILPRSRARNLGHPLESWQRPLSCAAPQYFLLASTRVQALMAKTDSDRNI